MKVRINNNMNKDSKLLAEAYQEINEAVNMGDIFFAIHSEQHEGDQVMGVYTSLEIAKKAVDQAVKEGSEDWNNIEVRKISLNKKLNFNYIDPMYHGKIVYKPKTPTGAKNIRGLAMGMQAQQDWE